MQEYKAILGIAAIILTFISYIPYFRDIFKDKTKPHAFTWLIWSVLLGIIYAAQVVKGGGAGSWATIVTVFVIFGIFIAALYKGERSFTKFDWISLLSAIIAMLIWWLTKDPTLSVILVVTIMFFGYLPTYRKTYKQPFSETISTYVIASLKHIVTIFALEAYSIATWLSPASVLLLNIIFITMVMIRRKQLNKNKL